MLARNPLTLAHELGHAMSDNGGHALMHISPEVIDSARRLTTGGRPVGIG